MDRTLRVQVRQAVPYDHEGRVQGPADARQMQQNRQIPVGMADENRGYAGTGEYRRRLLHTVWPYVIVVMLVFAISILAAQDPAWPLFAAGWAVALACIAVAFLNPQLWLIAPFGALGAVVLIRWGTDGLESGVGPLLLVPTLAVALYGSRRWLAAILALGAAVIVAIHLGANQSELVLTPVWRQDLIMLVLAAVLGAAVNDLVGRLRAERRSSELRERRLETVSAITRAIATSHDPARALCRRTVELTTAAGAALFRQQGGVPELLAWENADPARLRELGDGPIREILNGLSPGPAGGIEIYRPGSPRLEQCRPAWESGDVDAVVCAPTWSGGEPDGLLILAWPELARPEDSAVPLELLAAEASISIRNHELTESLERLALTDALTGVANRRGWEQQMRSVLGVAGRHRRPVTLAILDLDGFKAYNDSHGHQAGDRLLLESVTRWRQLIRAGDQLARYGGDEFVLTMPETSLDQAVNAATRICRSVSARVGCSAGVAEWDGSESAAELLERADRALYDAKADGSGVQAAGRVAPGDPAPGGDYR